MWAQTKYQIFFFGKGSSCKQLTQVTKYLS